MKFTRILLVDDDVDDQTLFIDALSQINSTLKCEIANNGLEAMLSLRTRTQTPDIIFLDLNMPKMNGYDCLVEIKSEIRFNHIPVVIYSTSKIETEKQRMLQMGARYFFIKPNDFSVLVDELSRILQSDLK